MEQTNVATALPAEEPQWKIEKDDDKIFGIETKRYDNGQVMKRAKLSDGRIAVARRLKGRDSKEISRLSGGNEEAYQDAVITVCLTINDEKVTIEDIQDMWHDDKTLVTMLASTNFPSAQNG